MNNNKKNTPFFILTDYERERKQLNKLLLILKRKTILRQALFEGLHEAMHFIKNSEIIKLQ